MTAIRVFVLAPKQFEDQVKFMVLEDKNGKLWLSHYMGD